MSSAAALNSPPPRPSAQTRSSGAAASPCVLCSPPARDDGVRSPVLCSPPARDEGVRSPLGGHVKATDDPVGLMVEAWCSPTLVSPAGRQCSVLQLEHHQAAGPVNINDAFLEEKQWDMEAMVLYTIGGQIEDEEEEEEEEEGDECGGCVEGDEDGPSGGEAAFGGWALGFRGYGSAGCRDSSCEGGCAAAHTSTPSQAVSRVCSSDGSRLPTSGTAQERKEQHFEMASVQGHAAFACGCPIARARGATSCLDRFGKEQFRRWHNETYGVTADGSAAKHLDPATSIHRKLWELKEPLADTGEKGLDGYGRKWQIKTWKLDGHEVCRKGWMLAVGGTEKMHRTVLSCVLRGHGPGDAAAEVSVKKMLGTVEAVLDASGTRDNEKRGYAAHWWKNYLLLCDWLPNEQKIQIRGPTYAFLHKSVYGAAAEQAGMKLSYKVWMSCKAEGLVLVASLLKGSDPKTLKASRSARHSKCATTLM